MLKLSILFATLLVTWTIFSGYLNVFFITCGVISCAISVYYAQRMKLLDEGRLPIYLHPKAWVYYAWLIKEIVIASFDVAMRVWQPKPNISPTLGWITSSQTNEMGKATYANSITLTPGTVCIEVDGDDMCVHAIVKDGLDDLKTGRMDKKVTQVTG